MTYRPTIAALAATLALGVACKRDRNNDREPIVARTAVEGTGESLVTVQQIRQALIDDPTLSPAARSVVVALDSEGIVTLRGPVASEPERALVERHAALIVGENRVRTDLSVAVVAPPMASAEPQPQAQPSPPLAEPAPPMPANPGMAAPSGGATPDLGPGTGDRGITGDASMAAPGVVVPLPGTTGTPTGTQPGAAGNVPGTTAPSPSSPGSVMPTPSPGTTPTPTTQPPTSSPSGTRNP